MYEYRNCFINELYFTEVIKECCCQDEVKEQNYKYTPWTIYIKQNTAFCCADHMTFSLLVYGSTVHMMMPYPG